MQPPPHRPPPPPGPVVARPATVVSARPAVNPSLPTMADLDSLRAQLDTIDQTLADLDLTQV